MDRWRARTYQRGFLYNVYKQLPDETYVGTKTNFSRKKIHSTEHPWKQYARALLALKKIVPFQRDRQALMLREFEKYSGTTLATVLRSPRFSLAEKAALQKRFHGAPPAPRAPRAKPKPKPSPLSSASSSRSSSLAASPMRFPTPPDSPSSTASVSSSSFFSTGHSSASDQALLDDDLSSELDSAPEFYKHWKPASADQLRRWQACIDRFMSQDWSDPNSLLSRFPNTRAELNSLLTAVQGRYGVDVSDYIGVHSNPAMDFRDLHAYIHKLHDESRARHEQAKVLLYSPSPPSSPEKPSPPRSPVAKSPPKAAPAPPPAKRPAVKFGDLFPQTNDDRPGHSGKKAAATTPTEDTTEILAAYRFECDVTGVFPRPAFPPMVRFAQAFGRRYGVVTFVETWPWAGKTWKFGGMTAAAAAKSANQLCEPKGEEDSERYERRRDVVKGYLITHGIMNPSRNAPPEPPAAAPVKLPPVAPRRSPLLAPPPVPLRSDSKENKERIVRFLDADDTSILGYPNTPAQARELFKAIKEELHIDTGPYAQILGPEPRRTWIRVWLKEVLMLALSGQ